MNLEYNMSICGRYGEKGVEYFLYPSNQVFMLTDKEWVVKEVDIDFEFDEPVLSASQKTEEEKHISKPTEPIKVHHWWDLMPNCS